MAIIAISAGHNSNAVGACHDGFCEFPETLRWAERIAQHLLEMGHSPVLIPATDLKQKVRAVNDSKAAFALEVHFNSGSLKAAGSETLYCPGSARGKMAAKRIQAAVSQFFTPDRGVKEGWYRMDRPGVVDFEGDKDGDEVIDYFLRKTNCPAVIIEPEFIHHREKIESNRDACCLAIAKAVHFYLSS